MLTYSHAHLLAHLPTHALNTPLLPTQYSPLILPARGPCGRAGVWPHSTWCDAWVPPRTHLSASLHSTVSLPRRGELVEELRALERALDFELCVDGERRRPA